MEPWNKNKEGKEQWKDFKGEKKKEKQRKAKYAEPINKAVQKPIQKPVAVYQGVDGEDKWYYDEQRGLWLPEEVFKDLKEEEHGSSTESNGNADENDDGNAQGSESEAQDENVNVLWILRFLASMSWISDVLLFCLSIQAILVITARFACSNLIGSHRAYAQGWNTC